MYCRQLLRLARGTGQTGRCIMRDCTAAPAGRSANSDVRVLQGPSTMYKRSASAGKRDRQRSLMVMLDVLVLPLTVACVVAACSITFVMACHHSRCSRSQELPVWPSLCSHVFAALRVRSLKICADDCPAGVVQLAALTRAPKRTVWASEPEAIARRMLRVDARRAVERGGPLIFTHLRRTGGSTVEYQLLRPRLRCLSRLLAVPRLSRSFCCWEGEHARFASAATAQRARLGKALGEAGLAWRHCPYGLHELLPGGVLSTRTAPPVQRLRDGGDTSSHLYLTVLRDPAERMLSWYAYCRRLPGAAGFERDGHCGAGGTFVEEARKQNVSAVAAFYSARERRLASEVRGARAGPQPRCSHERGLWRTCGDGRRRARR